MKANSSDNNQKTFQESNTFVIILLTLLLVFSTIFFYYYIAFNPSQKVIKSKIENEFISNMKMKVILFENKIAQYIQGAKSISSRSMIRDKMAEYYRKNRF